MKALQARFEKIGSDAFFQEFMHIPTTRAGMPVFKKSYTYKIVEPIKEVNGVKYYRELFLGR